MTERILVVDDDPQIVRALRTGLRSHGYEVVTAGNGETALDRLTETVFDIVVLDLGLPGIDGHEVIRRLRSWSDVPVIVLSVRESQRDKVAALDAGADDFVVKPFAIQELLARVRAVGRRARPSTTDPSLAFGGLLIDLNRQLVELDGERLNLTPTEHRLLVTMATNAGKLLTHTWLLQKVWGSRYQDERHLLRVYVQQLRRKLHDDPAHPSYIVTETGVGYRWNVEPDPAN
jgi:two-component system KDP operon response regulator KdpE